MTAAWITSYNQSQVLIGYRTGLDTVEPSAENQLAQAAAYNAALGAGVVLDKNSNVPVGDGALDGDVLDYDRILVANADGLMARVKVPSIDIDLPVYHGTSDAVLNRGAGHLEGSHLPIGGDGAHAVITAHRGLANATMFTNLNRVDIGDAITVETFGRVLTYEVRDITVTDPADSQVIRAENGKDLLTLITCTPLGVNTHRIVVTAERVANSTQSQSAAGAVPTIPGFPWWAVLLGGGVLLIGGYLARQGFTDARRARYHRDAPENQAPESDHPRREKEQ